MSTGERIVGFLLALYLVAVSTWCVTLSRRVEKVSAENLRLNDRIVVLESALKWAMARLDRLEKEAKSTSRARG